jgi:hypothetical protein
MKSEISNLKSVKELLIRQTTSWPLVEDLQAAEESCKNETNSLAKLADM